MRRPAGAALALCAWLCAVFCATGTARAATLDPLDFLVTSRCADGAPPLATCAAARRQTAGDAMAWRRHDWPAPDGYQIEDAFVGRDGRATLIWSYPPFGPFVAANGDGGEVYGVTRGAVTIAQTQDGGTSGMQYFTGAECGGTGWLVFKADAPTGRWASQVATLAGSQEAWRCPSLNRAFTRWRLENVAVPFIVQGRARRITVPAIISEHYDGPSIAASRHLERSLFGKGWGRLVWEAWGMTPPTVDLTQRCGTTAWSKPPAPGWLLEDCRFSTNLVAADGAMSGEKYAWPKAPQRAR